MKSVKRVILIVLDSVGIGAMPDAVSFGDEGADTLGHIASSVKGFALPNLASIGLGHIEGVSGVEKVANPTGAFARAAEHAQGKDTITGHWEIAGLHHDVRFPYFPDGFPSDMITSFEERIGRKVIGNIPASGTVIIDELGEEHITTGRPILYTSSDSVFQIAMHEDVISLNEQYQICEVAREMLTGKWAVGRVIARPFSGRPGAFKRTSNRKDYSIAPPGMTVLDHAAEAGLPVTGVGKISDIFCGQGITSSLKTKDNDEGITRTIGQMAVQEGGIIFTNLVDFDMLFGHRRDVEGYAQCLISFDRRLPEILSALRDGDLLLLTADHGNDPTYMGTDHTREFVPVLAYGSGVKSGSNAGTRNSFADIGATLSEHLAIPSTPFGQSFYAHIHL